MSIIPQRMRALSKYRWYRRTIIAFAFLIAGPVYHIARAPKCVALGAWDGAANELKGTGAMIRNCYRTFLKVWQREKDNFK